MMWCNNGIVEKQIKTEQDLPNGYVLGRIPKLSPTAIKVNNFIGSANLDDFKNFCSTHFQTEVMKEYNLNRKVVRAIYKQLGLNSFRNIKGRPSVRTHESYVLAGKKSAQTQKIFWENKTDEEKLQWSNLQKQLHATPEVKKNMRDGQKRYRDNMTPEQKERDRLMKSTTQKHYWLSLSEDEKIQVMNKKFIGGAGYHTANSKPNLQFKALLDKHNISYSREYRIDKFAYDFKVDNVLIEINPAFTHNSTYNPFNHIIDRTYHSEKTKCAYNNGFRCIHIWDWDNVDLILDSLTGKCIGARKCVLKEVPADECKQFLIQYHFQGSCRGQSIRLGLYLNDELIQIMTFGKPRYNKNYDWELLRLCTKSGYRVIGGANKLFNHFRKTYSGSIISYCDNSKFNGDVYIQMGMSLKSSGTPTCHWYNMKTHTHITDALLRQKGFDKLLGKEYGFYGKGTNNRELMIQHDFVEIYDCGQSVYTFIN